MANKIWEKLPSPSRDRSLLCNAVRPRCMVIIHIIVLSVLLTGFSSLVWAELIGDLRTRQNRELIELQREYNRLARERVPRTSDGRVDTQSREYRELMAKYRARKRSIMERYKALDKQVRGKELIKTIDDFGGPEGGRIKNTGGKTGDPYGLPKNVQADIDLAATDLDAAQELTERWVKNNTGKPVEIYTIDNPREPIRVSPDELDKVEWKKVVKAINPNTDTTLWTPQTEEIAKAKIGDYDAWTQPGALQASGLKSEPRDMRGFVEANEGKLRHSDRPVKPITGAHDEDLKTFAKSAAKAGKATGRTAKNPEFYKQAETLQNYGDAYEAGIATLGEDSPEAASRKVEEWKSRGRAEFEKAKKIGQQTGDRTDSLREDLARQTREAARRQREAGRPNADQMEEAAQAIEDRRQRVAKGNREAAAENNRLRAEADEAYGRSSVASVDSDSPVSAASDVADGTGSASARAQAPDPQNRLDVPGKTKIGTPKGDPELAELAKQGGNRVDIGEMSRGREDPAEIAERLGIGRSTYDGTPSGTRAVSGDPDMARLANPDQAVVKAQGHADLGEMVQGVQAREQARNAAMQAETRIGKGAPNAMPDDVAIVGPGAKVTPFDDMNRMRAGRPSWDTGPSDVARINPDAKVKRIDGRTPRIKPSVGAQIMSGIASGLEVGGQALERSARQMGKAVDENRDMTMSDAGEIAADLVPGVAGYKGTRQALLDRQIARLRRQDRIAQLQAKGNRTLEEDIELSRLQHDEKNNPDTAWGNATSMVREKMGEYIDEMEAQAKKEGRDRPEFWRDGVPMFGRMARDAINQLNPINQIGTPLAEGAAELSTLDERADAASTRDALTQYVDSEARQADHRIRRNTTEFDRLLNSGDLSNPAVQARLQELLGEIREDNKRVDRLVNLANGSLQDVDPNKLGNLRGINRSRPDPDALADYMDQIVRDRGVNTASGDVEETGPSQVRDEDVTTDEIGPSQVRDVDATIDEMERIIRDKDVNTASEDRDQMVRDRAENTVADREKTATVEGNVLVTQGDEGGRGDYDWDEDQGNVDPIRIAANPGVWQPRAGGGDDVVEDVPAQNVASVGTAIGGGYTDDPIQQAEEDRRRAEAAVKIAAAANPGKRDVKNSGGLPEIPELPPGPRNASDESSGTQVASGSTSETGSRSGAESREKGAATANSGEASAEPAPSESDESTTGGSDDQVAQSRRSGSSGRSPQADSPQASPPTATGASASGQPGDISVICPNGIKGISIWPHQRHKDEKGNSVLVDPKAMLSGLARAQQGQLRQYYQRGQATVTPPRLIRQKLSFNGAARLGRNTCGGTPMWEMIVRPGSTPPRGVLKPRKNSSGSYSCCVITGLYAPDEKMYFVWEQSIRPAGRSTMGRRRTSGACDPKVVKRLTNRVDCGKAHGIWQSTRTGYGHCICL